MKKQLFEALNEIENQHLISFRQIMEKSDGDGLIFMGLSIPDEEIDDTMQQIESWFREINMISNSTVKINNIYKITGNIMGEDGRTDWFIEWNKDYTPAPLVRLQYGQDIKWISDFINIYKKDYLYE